MQSFRTATDRMKIIFTIPLTKDLIVSEANRGGEHWTKKHKRHQIQEFLINSYFNTIPQEIISLPCIVKMTRIAPRFLDEDENLRCSVKYFKDYIAARLIPGNKSAGMKDNDPRIKWAYDQIKGKVREYALKIEICINDVQ